MNGTHRFAELVSTIIRVAVSVGVPLVKGASKGSVKVLKQINHYKPKIENFYQISIHCSPDRVRLRQSDCFSIAGQNSVALKLVDQVSNKSLQF